MSHKMPLLEFSWLNCTDFMIDWYRCNESQWVKEVCDQGACWFKCVQRNWHCRIYFIFIGMRVSLKVTLSSKSVFVMFQRHLWLWHYYLIITNTSSQVMTVVRYARGRKICLLWLKNLIPALIFLSGLSAFNEHNDIMVLIMVDDRCI